MADSRGTVRTPDFPPGLDWINTNQPVSLKNLLGKTVILDFWTAGCINCMHVIPELKKLEARYPETLAVIGVHAGKFAAERKTENVRAAVRRYDVRHPVVNDNRYEIWDSYTIRAWPTLVMISPDGRVAGHHPGEFAAEDFARVIDELESKFAGNLNRAPMPECTECDKDTGTLKFPGKVIMHEGRLFIADTGHNRILITGLDGRIQQVIGSGGQGMDDGPLDSATFYFPQGMAADGNLLYVADTWNHAIRRVDLASGRVERIAGTGNQAMLHRRSGPALETDLSSPWDVALGPDGTLYIAMAGNHQIWAMDATAGTVRTFAGTGREALDDGTLTRCALAQTSGLSFAEDRLYFADAESSSIRVADIMTDMVRTFVGQGLFDFGDRDGPGEFALLQHTLGVSYSMGELYLADTYNNKIKRINAVTSDCETILGSGEGVHRDGVGAEASFWEPGGIFVHEDRIYIADTNNHAIRVAEISGRTVSTLSIR